MRAPATNVLNISAGRRLVSALRASSLRLDVDASRALVDRGALLVDVRRHDDPSGYIDGALRISPDELPGRLAELPRDRPILLACT